MHPHEGCLRGYNAGRQQRAPLGAGRQLEAMTTAVVLCSMYYILVSVQHTVLYVLHTSQRDLQREPPSQHDHTNRDQLRVQTDHAAACLGTRDLTKVPQNILILTQKYFRSEGIAQLLPTGSLVPVKRALHMRITSNTANTYPVFIASTQIAQDLLCT